MSTGAIIGVGVLFLMLIVIGVVVYFTMGGDGESNVGKVCTPQGTPDPNATYKYGANDVCLMTCKTGYEKKDGACVEKTLAPSPAGPLTCSSPGSPSLSGKYWIVSADGHHSANRMIYVGASGTDGRAQLAEWDYWADPKTKWDIKEVPGEAGTYWIVSDASHHSANRMIYVGASGTDGRAQLAEWDYWADPKTKWKLLADPKAPGEYWIVSDANHHSPCRMIYVGASGADGRAQLAEWDYWEDPGTKWKLTHVP
jgi:hypothetical protein